MGAFAWTMGYPYGDRVQEHTVYFYQFIQNEIAFTNNIILENATSAGNLITTSSSVQHWIKNKKYSIELDRLHLYGRIYSSRIEGNFFDLESYGTGATNNLKILFRNVCNYPSERNNVRSCDSDPIFDIAYNISPSNTYAYVSRNLYNSSADAYLGFTPSSSVELLDEDVVFE